jgi:predicted ATPase
MNSSDDRLPESISPDRLFLQIASARPFFQRVYRLLSSFGFYNLNLRVIRELQDPNVGDLLQSDGGNLAAVISTMRDRDPGALRRLEEYLGAVVPGVRGVSARHLGPKETIEIRQEVAGDRNPWRYLAANVSDGTLRALGVLAAVLQSGTTPTGIPLVTIEEPEIAIHPGASVRLMDALLEASHSRQLIVTTHSPDLLDHPRIDVDSILAVEAVGGNSLIAPVDDATRNAVPFPR